MINLSICPNHNVSNSVYEASPNSLSYLPTRSMNSSSQTATTSINPSFINHQYPQFNDSTMIYQPNQPHANQQCISGNSLQFNIKNPNYIPTSNQIQNHNTINDNSSRFQQTRIQTHTIPRPTTFSSPTSSPGPIVSGVNLNDNYITLNTIQNYPQQVKISSLPSNQNNNNNTNNSETQNYQSQIQSQHLYPNYNTIVAALTSCPVESKAPWTADEDDTLTKMYEQIGPQWARISEVLPGRTISQIRSRRNAIESRKRQRQKAAMKQLKIAPELKQQIEQRKQLYEQKFDSRGSAASSSPIYNSYVGPYQPSTPINVSIPKQIPSSSTNTIKSHSNHMKETQNEKFYCSIESLLN
ncbi:hypothetical protein M9Y10_044034 [Tritrichomonas musculus]|uniref:Myb-like DNA-binding domain containing protein n=1 Tax=Tritrichomonas musculus TaxID=1915356 RepID=A0ABR2K1R3_9EUKA